MATTSNADTDAKLYFEYGGQTYKAVKIGTQMWMAENLNYEVEGSKFYENSLDNGAKYGRLYNWETAMKVCPKGWHLPTNEEWDKLFRFVDSDAGSKSPYKSESAGKHLKAASGWNFHIGYGNGTDNYGFSALPGGGGNLDGSFSNIGSNGLWWSASESNSSNAYYRYMSCNNDRAYWSHGDKSDLYSVRCLQD
ncbi:MAG: hypothetical protein LBQ87_02410 [Candidatus Fibromonas sp.]|jgi:uncharacterized protein (TIGR02145 family)|nr:hypothetical protein [Candidatus Fibromonas sp.]